MLVVLAKKCPARYRPAANGGPVEASTRLQEQAWEGSQVREVPSSWIN